MFEAYEFQPHLGTTRYRLIISFAMAAIALGICGMLLSALSSSLPQPEPIPKPKQVDVIFRPPPAPEPVLPPPPPKVAPQKTALPTVTKTPQAAPAARVVPKEVPTQAALESDTAVTARAAAVGGTGDGTADESPSPSTARGNGNAPVSLPEEAEPAEPSEDNAQPDYPESARLTGKEAKVVLKVVIGIQGQVGHLQVLKGEEPFISAALAAVKTWKYQPATLEGSPISVFKIITITFSLRN